MFPSTNTTSWLPNDVHRAGKNPLPGRTEKKENESKQESLLCTSDGIVHTEKSRLWGHGLRTQGARVADGRSKMYVCMHAVRGCPLPPLCRDTDTLAQTKSAPRVQHQQQD